MTDDRWEAAKAIVNDALDHPTAEREAFIATACGDDSALHREVCGLLEMEVKADHVFGDPGATASIDPATGMTIGRYEVRRVIASGGMGVVYEATQNHPHRLVALKMLRRGASSPIAMKRFRHEAEILGRLRHANIAQIYDAGTHDVGEGAQPYFVMELVHGQPLLAYAESKKLGTRARLNIFARICDAVQYAHQQGVIHRDLKPDNILVDEHGEPKILDFGIARATDSDMQVTTLRTDIGQLIGTVPYMSPEQVSGDPNTLDTRSDVYSLGVVLYELVSGQLPYDVSSRTIPDAVRVIQEEDARPLSSVDRVFRGDVDTIVGKALEKEKSRRYQTAADLAADVRRYLADEPVTARPASTFYQLRKFARRHKAIVAGIAVSFATLLAGTAGMTWQWLQARTQAARATAVSSFLLETLSAPDPYKEGRDVKVADLLAPAVTRLESFADLPEIQALLYHTIGVTYQKMGLDRDAETQLQSALAIRQRVLSAHHPDTIATKLALADLCSGYGDFACTTRLMREVLEDRDRLLRRDPIQAYEAMAMLAHALARHGDQDEALDLSTEAAEGFRRVLGEADERTVGAQAVLAGVLEQRGDLQKAEQILTVLVENARRRYGEDDPRTLLARNDLAYVIRYQRRSAEAEEMFLDILERRRRVFGDHSNPVANTLNCLGLALEDQGKLVEAERAFAETADYMRGLPDVVAGTGEPNLVRVRFRLGTVSAEDAAIVMRDRLHWIQEHRNPGWVALWQAYYGSCLTALKQYDDAEQILLESFATARNRLGENHIFTAKARDALIELYDAWDKPEKEAEYRALPAEQPGDEPK